MTARKKYRVRSRVLIDVEHVVDAEDANLARQTASLTARELHLKARERACALGIEAYVLRGRYDGLVDCELDEQWVECRPWSTTPGMRNVVTFLGHGEPGLARNRLSLADRRLLRSRLTGAGFNVLSEWSDFGGPDADTAVSFRLDQPASTLNVGIVRRLCAPRPVDEMPPLELREGD